MRLGAILLVLLSLIGCATLPPTPLRYRGLVRFEVMAEPGQHFEVVGSWNNWERGQHPLTSIYDYYYTEIALPSGTYEFVFFNKNNKAFLPIHIKNRLPDGFGGTNGVLYVP